MKILEELGITKSSIFNFSIIIICIVITYILGDSLFSNRISQKDKIIESIFQGGILGIFVGQSITRFFLSIRRKDEKWNAIGWISVGCLYGIYQLFFYEGIPSKPIAYKLYWRILMWFTANFVLGWWLLGTFLKVKFQKRDG